MTLVFLDTETTGLELYHDIWEIAWAVGDGPIGSMFVPHTLTNADPEALDLNGYWSRFYQRDIVDPLADPILREALKGATLVGANPAFDAYRLQRRWGAQPWHYRLLDISSMAVQAFGLNNSGMPPGLAEVRSVLLEHYADSDVSIPEPDHTAAGDVATVRACYNLLRRVRL